MSSPILFGLSDEELEFCDSHEYELGVDVDDAPVQYIHVCYPKSSGGGALCQTQDLWGQPGKIVANDKFNCLICLNILRSQVE